ncbi:helix-turn-helix transcriptional regulator [Actinoplanes sp. NBRC 103695]|uniref:helix-turn-helix transcriptional regulator n=1 Tax=Actinoplanes sp. NBRC 103695 TaxID=3032202 RepID=UPI00255638EA|nr:helix-turn-helix transcriptional regulator [Actinoplanes sp. NBRC 103695]
MTVDGYTFSSAIKATLADLGVPAGPILRAARLPEDLFLSPQVTLKPDEFFRLRTAAETFTGEPALGLSVTTEMPSAPPPPPGLVAWELTFWVALARLGTRTTFVPAKAIMPDPPDAEAYRDYLGVRIGRGASVTVVFTSLDARRPFLTANDAMWKIFEDDPRRRLADLGKVETTAVRVQAALLELLPAGQGTAQDVSRRLAMSGRSLQRRLAQEGTTFQAVLGRTRHRLAQHYLARDDITITEIALLLGYDEPNSFRRAFHKWSGQTPHQARTESARRSTAFPA